MTGPRPLRLLVLLACVLSWSSTAWAANPHLERAKKELDDLKYDAAAASLEQALRVGESGPKELAEIYELSARVAAARGDVAAAEDFFRHLLALAPETTLPAGVSPKIAEPFQAARSFIDERLPIACRWQKDPSDSAVQLLVDADPLSMVHGAEVIWIEDGAPKRVVRHGSSPFIVPVPKQSELEVRIAAVDEFGNHIAEFGTAKKPLVVDTMSGGAAITPPSHAEGKDGGGRPLIAKWWLWGGVAVVSAGVGTYFGLDVLKAKDEIEELNRRTLEGGMPVQYSEALAIQDRGNRSATICNISFGVAGAAAVAAVILFATEPKAKASVKAEDEGADEEAEEETSFHWSPALGGGQVGIVWTGSF